MGKIASWIVEKRKPIFFVMLALTLACAVLMTQVNINYDMTKYLDDSSLMKQGLDIMNAEFPEAQTLSTVRVMFEGLPESERAGMKTRLEAISHVQSVAYTAGSADYEKDGYTLYVLSTPFAYGTPEESGIEKTLASDFNIYSMQYKNDNTTVTEIPVWILLTAVALVMAVLFFMCASWTEPFLFLLTIGMAIALNMGTNYFLGSISNITFSIAAILQLVLSMDYSIILMNRFRQEKELAASSADAMKAALTHAFSSIASSALTTIVGLLALLFMTFKIGEDLGLVLAKGVLCSMLCIFTLLPAMILFCEKLIEKTKKKRASLRMDAIGTFFYRHRKVAAVLFLAVCAASYLMQKGTQIAYTLETTDPVAEVFQGTDTLVMIYENADEENVDHLMETLDKNEYVKSQNAYGNTLGKLYSAQEMSAYIASMGSDMMMDESIVNMLYYLSSGGQTPETVPVSALLSFLSNADLSAYGALIPQEMQGQLSALSLLSDENALQTPMSASDMAERLGVDGTLTGTVYVMMGKGAQDAQFTPAQFIDYVSGTLIQNPLLSGQITAEQKAQIAQLRQIKDAVLAHESYTKAQLGALFGTDDSMTDLLMLYYASSESTEETKLSLAQMFDYLSETMLNDARFSAFFTKETRDMLAEAKKQLDDGAAQLKSERYSRLVIVNTFKAGSEEATAFYDMLTEELQKTMQGNYYLIGNSAMSYEMQKTFSDEMLRITLLSAAAIFLVVAITFRSLLIPALLVAIVQCGVYLTVSVIGLQGYSIYYLALLIVQCLLMGSTIDYGILFTNYYIENRKKKAPVEALKAAYNGSIHTVMTSGLIMVIVCAIVGYCFSEPTIGQICRTISIGALCAILLILIFLPALLSALDRFAVKKTK